MLVVEQYFRTGLIAYLWSKYLWRQMLERRQRHILDTFKTAPVELRAMIDEEQYETHRNAALYRSGFEIVKETLDVGAATTLILFQGFRKLWQKSADVVAYFDIEDSNDVVKNALFLTMLTSGTYLLHLPFAMFEIYVKRSEDSEKRISITNILLGHSIAQTLLFPFVCLFILAFKLGGDRTLLWAFGFAEFQLLADFLNNEAVRPLPACDLKKALEEIAEKYEFPLQEVFVARRMNGRKKISLRGFPQPRSIVISEDLAHGDSGGEDAVLTIQDINALAAREISHWKRGHSYINFVVNQAHLCLHMYTMHRFLNSQRVYEAVGFDNRPLAVGLTLLQYCPLFDLYNFAARTVSRHLEYVADEDVKRTQGDTDLKRAIVKTGDHARIFPVQDSLYSICCNAEATAYERINALNECNR